MTATGGPTAEELALDWAPWLSELIELSTEPPERVDDDVHFNVAGRTIRATAHDPRFGRWILPRDARLFVQVGDSGRFFDVRDWFALVGADGEVGGRAQLELLDRLDEIDAIGSGDDVVASLRGARDEWVLSQGVRAVHDDVPVWPDGLVCPGWMSELDEGLLGVGFDSGWIVRVGVGDPIGLVRQRGPVRVQLTVLDGVPLVQVGVWPLVPWRPLSVVEEFFGRARSDEVGAVVESAQLLADATFAGFGPPMWRAPQRIAEAEAAGVVLSQELGPRPGQEYFALSGPMPYRVFDSKDLGRVGDTMGRAETYQGGRDVVVGRSSSAKAGSFFYGGDAHVIVNRVLLDVFTELVPDLNFCEFFSDGEPFYVVVANNAHAGDLVDRVRSRTMMRRAADGCLVLDPRQIGRPSPGDRGHLFGTPPFVVDAAAKAEIERVAPDVRCVPIWDPSRSPTFGE